MALPTLTGPGARFGDFFAPWIDGVDDPTNQELWLWLAAALGRCFEHVEILLRDQADGTPGFAVIFDPVNCPDWALPWLAMVAGVSIALGGDVTAQRSLIHPDSNKRGTTGAIGAAVATTLTGTKSVTFVERVGTAYRHQVITLTAETPSPTVTAAVLLDPTVKPVGEWFTHIVADSWTIAEMEGAYATIALLEAAFTDLAHLETRAP